MKPSFRFREISFVDLEADKFFHAAFLCGDGGISDSEKRIEHRLHASRSRGTVELDAILGECDRKCGRVRPIPLATLNRFVGNEPGIAATAQVGATGMRPPGNVAFVLIRNAEREPVDLDVTVDGEMKNIFVAVIQKSFRADRFEVSEGPIINGDRFDPVNRILENKNIAQLKNDFVRKHRV